MNTLLAIISTARDNALVARHWPYFKLPAWTILGVGTEDGKCEWPEPVTRLDCGKQGTRMTPVGPSIFGLIQQEMEIWGWFLSHREFDSVCIVETDNLFVRKPPDHPGQGLYLVTQLPNYSPLFKTPMYFSTPRWSDRKATEQLFAGGSEMIRQRDTEHDISDRFPALIAQRYRIPWLAQPAWSPSLFTVTGEQWVRDARAAIQLGMYCLHSVKTQQQLDALKDLLPCP